MSDFGNLLMELFRNYNMWFLSLIIIIQCIGIPTGASLLVIASGAFAYSGEYNIVVLILEVWFFSILGDSLAYILWKFLGLKMINKSSRVQRYFEPKLLKSKLYLEKHGKTSVFLTRFLISAMGPFVNAAAGITGYNLVIFIIFVALGEFFWTSIYLGLGYWFGDSWESIVPIATEFGQLITYILIILICGYFLLNTLRKKKSYVVWHPHEL